MTIIKITIKMTKEEELRKKYLEFQTLQQQMEKMSQHVEMLQLQSAELDLSLNTLKGLEETSLNSEILAPIADGIFIRTLLQDNHNLLLNVGSNTTIEKTIPETILLLESQKKELSVRMVEVEELMNTFNKQALKIYQEVENVQQTKE